MATAHPKLALRPFLPADTPLLAEIFRESIMELTADDYSEAQQQAWVSAADDLEAFAKRLGGQLSLIATLQGSPVGFASLDGAGKIDLLYVHPAAAGQGVGAMLIDALEKLAGASRRRKAHRRCQRHGARLFRKARLCRAATQFDFGRRRMARQHHACPNRSLNSAAANTEAS